MSRLSGMSILKEEAPMDALSSLSESVSALAAAAAAKVFHVPSPAGGRSAVSFDGSLLLVQAFEASEGEKLELLAPGGAEAEASVVGFDPRLGLAVLKLASPLPQASWTSLAPPPPLGSLLAVVAYPSPEGPEARLDVLRFAGGEGEDAYLQTAGSSFPGFSGAAIVEPGGALAGVLVSDKPGNRGWALPAARARDLVASIAERGFPGRAWLGISTVPIEAPESFAKLFGDDREAALMVAGLEEGGPAEAAGLMVGDLLVSIGGVATPHPAALGEAIFAAKPGEALPIVVVRGGERKELSAIPAARSGRGRGPHHDRGHGHGRGPWGFGHGRGWGGGRGCGCGGDETGR
jgi:S1-C subfamily serine protease